MVVQETCEDRVDDKHATEESDSEHRNNTENRNGFAMKILENSLHNGKESLDGEPEAIDLSRLKDLIPSITAKDNITQLDIILEAIRYIDSLQNKLADKIDTGEIVPIQVEVKRKEEDS
eukprot:GFUD01098355.1.p1 GENE.GFUD01098355.1~~GFUD01098355.1.p1  ORF type:complete len:119 (+),score=51.61 GFUD01098355.1:85-441(+)